MSQSASHEYRVSFPVASSPRRDGDGVSTAEFHPDDGLIEAVRQVGVQPSTQLTSSDFADLATTVVDRGLIEHAVGMLMFVYDLNADNAVELLKWGSQALDVTIETLARQLTEDVGPARDGKGLSRCERVDLRSACDDVLFHPRTGQSDVSARSGP